MFKSLLMFMSVSISLASCNQSASGGRTGTTGAVTGSNSGSTNPSSLPDGVARDKVTITFDPFTVTPTIFVRSTAENVCLPFKITIAHAGTPLEGATVAFSVSPMSATMKDFGEVLVVSQKSSVKGEVEGTYCSGDSEGQVVIAAELSGLIVNSDIIKVTVKPVFKLEYARSDVDPVLSPSEGLGDTSALYLNLVDSGPQDCTNVYFKLTKSGKPITGTKISFRSQIDFPAGAKFAKKSDPAKTALDSITNKKYLSYESFTNSSGEAAVPVCAGVFLGSIDVAASFVDEESRTYEAHSPIVRIIGGLTNWLNMSLMFDEINGRTLRAYYNTNSKYQLPITANIGSRMDGMPIKQYPLMVAAETGRITIDKGGFVDPETGTVKFTVQALHLVDNYPYQVYPFGDITQAQTRCQPAKIAEWGLANSKPYVNYIDIAKNWRSTLVYYIRGQEHYNDANGNGKYDEGGDGFWDRNQNGYYDSEDVLTYDAGNDGKLDRRGEWFIDLPTPFIDVDEDHNFDSSVDVLIGEKYEAPNAKRDSDTTDWKYEVLPISMGPSEYSLQHYRINTTDYRQTDVTAVMPWGSYPVFGVQDVLTATDLFTTADYSKSGKWTFALFAHDICGSVLPGNTKLYMTLEEMLDENSTDIRWGRYPVVNFMSPPEDRYLEPNRRLFKQTDTTGSTAGAVTAVLNFNTVDHPSKDYGYPIMGQITIPQCLHSCDGAVNPSDPGFYCSGWTGKIRLDVHEPRLLETSITDESFTTVRTTLELPPVNGCKCVGGSSKTAGSGSCACAPGKTFNPVTLLCE